MSKIKRRKLKSGDLVLVNGYDDKGLAWSCAKGKVDHMPGPMSDYWVCVNIYASHGGTKKIHVHRNQCTPIRIVKKQVREWWVNTRSCEYSTYFDDGYGILCRSTKPDDTDGWICLREVRKK